MTIHLQPLPQNANLVDFQSIIYREKKNSTTTMTSNPLTYEASAGETHMQVSSALPDEVIQCLRNARFLHLATCTTDLHPHVSLMNYTYLASTPFSPSPIIIMTTNPSSRKMHNLLSNPHVSLLVHDWVSHRPLPTASTTISPEPEQPAAHRSSLATLLQNLNSSALSSISASINGDARVVEGGTEEEKWLREAHLREAHLRNNTFGEGGGRRGESRMAGGGALLRGRRLGWWW
ncbi:hypothetical protein GMDG_02402 [Pseudogymnoascus destructans 20631-21]|uniref:Pyridoxamine 5'-phosphate oxidase N-terminal domain-containing protein n=1 Tax=Pseudogymnoascus destructans (strain ATCC MYA-4855 / 20631-21) TaxID=658429 RepID=L8G3B1_PSED2|nr:hypothetical protein GMDG_02402 [Pseudogymnoascus destructans 20631-21]